MSGYLSIAALSVDPGIDAICQKETSQQMASPKPHDISFGASPGRAQSADAGVGLGARCEFGFEFARERPVGGDLQLRAGPRRARSPSMAPRHCIDGEARARQRLERRVE